MMEKINKIMYNLIIHINSKEIAMKASVVDLRYKMRDVLKALDRNEQVSILYHGKTKGILMPAAGKGKKSGKLKEHPFFGMSKGHKKTVLQELEELRGFRFK